MSNTESKPMIAYYDEWMSNMGRSWLLQTWRVTALTEKEARAAISHMRPLPELRCGVQFDGIQSWDFTRIG